MGIVVVNYGSHRLLADNLGSAGELGPAMQVVVVDNFSTANERNAVQELATARGWHLVELPDNRGFGAAVNAGAAAAAELGCQTYLLLNPDAVITPGVLAELRAHSLREPECLISPVIVDSAGAVVFRGARLDLASGRIRSNQPELPPGGTWVSWLTAACLVVHRQLFERIGGMAEEFFLYWEDVDLSVRAVAAGGRLVVRDDLVAVHDEGGTQGRRGRAKSDRYYFHNCRNRLLFAARTLRRRDLLRWILLTPAVSREVLLRGGRRQLLASPRPLWSTVRGSCAGLAVAGAALLRSHPRGGGSSDPRQSAPAPRRPGVLLAHPGAELYGSDRVLLETVDALVDDYDVVVALPGEGPLATELRARGAEVTFVRMPVIRKAVFRPRGAARFAADLLLGTVPALRLVRRQADVVFVNTVTIPFWLVWARLLGRPAICHVHEAERSAPRLVRRMLALPVLLAARVVVNSAYSREVLTESLPRLRGRTQVVYNAVPGPAAVVEPRRELTDPFRMLYVGRLSPRKGPHVAVAALAQLTARGIDARLTLLGSTFAGYEWYERDLRDRVAAHELDEQVEFLGFQADIWPVLAAADVVLVPSQLDEPFGNTAVEALLAARPLVVSATSGLLEAASGYEAVEAVPPDEVGAWVAALERVITGWQGYAAAALRDATRARELHSPSRYQAEVRAVLHAVGPVPR
jgi:GT2 family glycosyltransferase/glycosyltransferase involved in cell wall biosynthesis